MPEILSGKEVQQAILHQLQPRIASFRESTGRPPGLAVILVGHNPASQIYVRNKVKACQELGIYSEQYNPPETTTTEDVVQLVESLNRRPDIDGILVQMPLPAQVDAQRVILTIDPAKDVDGFHPYNLGQLVSGRPGLRPCTPAGIMRLLEHYRIPVAGKKAVVIGRSDIVGKPMALMLLHAHATVTICHSRTADLAAEARQADLLVVAAGKPALVTAEFIKPGAVVVDVGINRVTDRARVEELFGDDPDKLTSFEKTGSVLVGDVHPRDVRQRAGAYTPVPGGVGPLTIAMLMANTVEAAERRLCKCSASGSLAGWQQGSPT